MLDPFLNSLSLSHKHLRAGLVLDTNLLLLLIVGRYDISKLALFRATRKYDEFSFRLLQLLVRKFRRIFATTNIVTEADNLSRKVSKIEWAGISAEILKFLREGQERQFWSDGLVSMPAHPGLGITDCSIIRLAETGLLVATDDFGLTQALERRELGVVNLSRIIGALA